MTGRLELHPVSLKTANEFVKSTHRHSKPTVGHKFSLAAFVDDVLVGVAIVGRPVGRGLDDGFTSEALRVCTDGTRNACSFLYGAAWRASRAMGYRRMVTYTLDSEGGASVRAAGGVATATVTPRVWDTPSRPRDVDHHKVSARVRWEWACVGTERP